MTQSKHALKALNALADPENAIIMAKYHKAERVYLGVDNPAIDVLVKEWRASCSLGDRITLASDLWNSDIHEARIAAGKLFIQARMRPDDAVWAEITRWVPQFDAWAIADHACSAGGRRLVADPSRIDEVEQWITHENMWTRRAALVMTLPWTKLNNPSENDLAIRERVMSWCVEMIPDQQWFIQKAIGWWLRGLSRHDPARVLAFLEEHGEGMKAFARNEATSNIKE
jgi:3-methyladenine DNA glycosylase AlkD